MQSPLVNSGSKWLPHLHFSLQASSEDEIKYSDKVNVPTSNFRLSFLHGETHIIAYRTDYPCSSTSVFRLLRSYLLVTSNLHPHLSLSE